MLSKLYILIPFVFLFTTIAKAQHDHDTEHEHHHSDFEIGMSNGYVYNLTEEEGAYGLHVHFMKIMGDRFGLGLGYEAIFDDHKHNAASLILEYRVTDHLLLNFAPGVSWLATKSNSTKPTLHLEGIYAFEIGKLHLGPLVAVAFNTEDFHASVGIHLAFGF